jgi:hypothetical protein
MSEDVVKDREGVCVEEEVDHGALRILLVRAGDIQLGYTGDTGWITELHCDGSRVFNDEAVERSSDADRFDEHG